MRTVTLGKMKINLSGNILSNTDKAPKVTLVDIKLKDYTVGGVQDNIQLILVVPSIDTQVCSKSSLIFEEKIKDMDINTVLVSMDLPFASERFALLNKINNIKMLSDFRAKEFGKKYGVFMETGILKGLLARAVFIIDKNGILVYNEIVSDITKEPNYEETLKAILKFR
jgi:thiol peroxidase